jgi:hypothetical protein
MNSGIIAIIAGAIMIVFARQISRFVIEFQAQLWKLHYDETYLKAGYIIIPIAGAVFVVWGILIIVG